jgi:signal transduction histidine kinase
MQGVAAKVVKKSWLMTMEIFERFYRVDKSRSGNSGGIGLGLAICQEIIHSHRGNIDVASAIGEGTTFTMRLPLRPWIS